MSESEGNTSKFLFVILGLVISASVTLATFNLKWTFEANAKIALLESQSMASKTFANDINSLRASIIMIEQERKREESQDKQIGMFWTYCKWLHDQINQIRFKLTLPPADSPNFN